MLCNSPPRVEARIAQQTVLFKLLMICILYLRITCAGCKFLFSVVLISIRLENDFVVETT